MQRDGGHTRSKIYQCAVVLGQLRLDNVHDVHAHRNVTGFIEHLAGVVWDLSQQISD